MQSIHSPSSLPLAPSLPLIPLSTASLPVIRVQPSPQEMIAPRKSASFTVTATGNQLSYQWKKNGIDIPGAIFPTFFVESVMQRHEGQYSCVISNDAGYVICTATRLTVCKCFTILIGHAVSKKITIIIPLGKSIPSNYRLIDIDLFSGTDNRYRCFAWSPQWKQTTSILVYHQHQQPFQASSVLPAPMLD